MVAPAPSLVHSAEVNVSAGLPFEEEHAPVPEYIATASSPLTKLVPLTIIVPGLLGFGASLTGRGENNTDEAAAAGSQETVFRDEDASVLK